MPVIPREGDRCRTRRVGRPAAMPSRRSRFAWVLLLGVLPGCMVGPDPTPPSIVAADAWHEDLVEGLTRGEVDPGAWWRGFDDPMLVDLVATAERNNFDLRTAASRIREARSLYGIAAADLYPELNAQGEAEFLDGNQANSSGLPVSDRELLQPRTRLRLGDRSLGQGAARHAGGGVRSAGADRGRPRHPRDHPGGGRSELHRGAIAAGTDHGVATDRRGPGRDRDARANAVPAGRGDRVLPPAGPGTAAGGGGEGALAGVRARGRDQPAVGADRGAGRAASRTLRGVRRGPRGPRSAEGDRGGHPRRRHSPPPRHPGRGTAGRRGRREHRRRGSRAVPLASTDRAGRLQQHAVRPARDAVESWRPARDRGVLADLHRGPAPFGDRRSERTGLSGAHVLRGDGLRRDRGRRDGPGRVRLESSRAGEAPAGGRHLRPGRHARDVAPRAGGRRSRGHCWISNANCSAPSRNSR